MGEKMLWQYEMGKILKAISFYIVIFVLTGFSLVICATKQNDLNNDAQLQKDVKLAQSFGVRLDEEFALGFYKQICSTEEFAEFAALYYQKSCRRFSAACYEESRQQLENWIRLRPDGEMTLTETETEILSDFKTLLNEYESLVYGPEEAYKALLEELERNAADQSVINRIKEIITEKQASFLFNTKILDFVNTVWKASFACLLIGSMYIALYPLFLDQESGASSVLDTTKKRFSFSAARYFASVCSTPVLYGAVFALPMLLSGFDSKTRLFLQADLCSAVLPSAQNRPFFITSGSITFKEYILLLFIAAFVMQQLLLLVIHGLNSLFQSSYISLCLVIILGAAVLTFYTIYYERFYNLLRFLPFSSLADPMLICCGLSRLPESWSAIAVIHAAIAVLFFVGCRMLKRRLYRKH